MQEGWVKGWVLGCAVGLSKRLEVLPHKEGGLA